MANHTSQLRVTAPLLPSSTPIAVAGVAVALLAGVLIARDLQLGLTTLVGLLYVPVVMLNLALGVILWVPLVFVERLPAVGIGQTLAAIMVGAAWLGALPSRRAFVAAVARRHQVMLSVLGLFLAWVTLSIVWAQDADAAAASFWNWYVAAAIFFVVATSLGDRRYVVAACAAFVAGALISAAVGLDPGAIDRGELAEDEASRLGGSLGDPNFLAAGLVPAMALATGLTSVWRGARMRWALVGCVVLLGIGLAATGSRGGLIAAGIAVATALLLVRGHRLQLGALALVATVLAGVWLAANSPSTWDRIRSFDTGNGRVDLWTIGWQMTEDHPISGVGEDNFRAESASYVRQPVDVDDPELIVERPHEVHNTYLQQLAETGVIGLALLAFVLLAALRATWEAARRFDLAGDSQMAGLARAALVAQLGGLSAWLFLSNGYDKRMWILLAFGPALLAVASRERPEPSGT
jgi:hypothetical protein